MYIAISWGHAPSTFQTGMKVIIAAYEHGTAWFGHLGNYKVIAQTTVAVLIRMTIETFW